MLNSSFRDFKNERKRKEAKLDHVDLCYHRQSVSSNGIINN